ncbi:MAG: ABC1 kinase family protein [Spirochaetales bacterium]
MLVRTVLRRRRLLRRTIRHSRRFQEIVGILARYGFADWLTAVKLDRRFRFVRKLISGRETEVPIGASRWQLIRMAFEELGPTFIKFGQLLSNRSDMLPAEFLRELEQLQDHVPAFDVEDVRRTISRDLPAANAEEVLHTLEPVPVASASIAQVHRARLRDGTRVAIKVQRPGLRELVEVDLDILKGLARLVETYLRDWRIFNPTGFVDEFRERLNEELDFTQEGRSIRRFGSIFRRNPAVRVPTVYTDHSSKRVLTMEYISGTRMSEVLKDRSGHFDRKLLARRAGELMLDQVYLHGFFHGDPHPGNLMVLPGNVICFLDFGMMGSLRPREREALTESALGLVDRDPKRVTEALLALTEEVGPVNRQRLEDEVFDLIDQYADASLAELDMGDLFQELVTIALAHNLRMHTRMLVMVKATVIMEGIGYGLDPDFQLMSLLEKFAGRIIRQRLHPKRLAKDAGASSLDLVDLLRDLPRDGRELVKKAKTGSLSLGIQVQGIEPLRNTLDNVSYRLVFGFVLAALMIASALMVHAGVPPTWNNIPVIGLGGFVVTGLLGIGFLLNIVVHVFRKPDR